MWSSDSDHDLTAVAAAFSPSSSSTTTTTTTSPPPSPPPPAATLLRRPRNRTTTRRHRRRAANNNTRQIAPAAEPEAAEDVWRGAQWEAAWPGRCDARPVLLAADDTPGGGDGQDDGGVGRSRSLTDDDLEELKGCADLGFGFSYDEIPELRGTLPALELCYSMSQRLLDDKHHQPTDSLAAASAPPAAPPVTNWKISSPGDSPDEVKARLKYWAQAVACTVRLCS
ncbi:unnamed protein product [Urochloa humidicola]